ncbi:SDR family NAD(P)-dependent oxidoreductase, partial [Streptomyces fradiae]|uniref:SDR family NAD(P)-dependent oxidoreductase n=1 Tax=Streptomyces fradiae TaxID=1906 RepID=UPI00117F0E64
MDHASPVAVVTGADSGIGRATAVRLAREGMDVGITWHTDEEGARHTAEEVRSHGRRAAVARMDLTDLPGAAHAVDDLARELGRIDVLVNNA